MNCRLFFILTLTLSSFNCFSQSVSITMSVDCRDSDKELCLKYSLPCISFISISYQNVSDRPLYCPKITKNDASFPPLALASTAHFVDSIADIAPLRRIYDRKYNIVMYGGTSYLMSWEIFDWAADYNIEHVSNSVNDVLCDINNIIEDDSLEKKNEPLKTDYLSTDITEAGILNIVKDNFVFLKPGETYNDYFNMISFQLLGGEYTFLLRSDTIVNSVDCDNYWNSQTKRWENNVCPLPQNVGIYQLAHGLFRVNELTVKYNPR